MGLRHGRIGAPGATQSLPGVGGVHLAPWPPGPNHAGCLRYANPVNGWSHATVTCEPQGHSHQPRNSFIWLRASTSSTRPRSFSIEFKAA